MKMTINTALEVLDITDQIVTRDQIKTSYRHLANRYHPDKNPNGLQEMQNINVAYDYLSKIPKNEFPLQNHSNDENYLRYLRNVYGLTIYRRNGKIYVAGNSYPARNILKSWGFRWYKEKRVWWCYD